MQARFVSTIAGPIGSLLVLAYSSFVAAASVDHAIVYSFKGSVPSGLGDGAAPRAGLVAGDDGVLYGTTSGGGANLAGESGAGTIFRITTSGTETVLYSFGATAGDGSRPGAGLTKAPDGNLYGTTEAGGAYGNGTVFRITPGGEYVQLHSFGSVPTDGANPGRNRLTWAGDGYLYGMTAQGGANRNEASGDGTIFRVRADGAYEVIYSFGETSEDGRLPASALTPTPDGYFYGTTTRGGNYSKGSVFRLKPGGEPEIVYSFGGCPGDPANPTDALTLAPDGNLYGTSTLGGPKNSGTIFVLTPSGQLSVLHAVGVGSSANVASPQGGVAIGSDGNFYATAAVGGAHNSGAAFMLSPQGTYTELYAFGSQPDDGEVPDGQLVELDGLGFYGITQGGGTGSAGTVFRLSVSGTPPGVFPSAIGPGPCDARATPSPDGGPLSMRCLAVLISAAVWSIRKRTRRGHSILR
ncbi:MAG: choice-of-anchor tandem repeat GloVer-containing protein [Armatimonadota bacterium]